MNVQKLFKRSFSDNVFCLIRKINRQVEQKRLYTRKYEYIDRSEGSSNLLIIIAGFQEYYWDLIFNRVKKNQSMFDENIDVCVCIPKGNGSDKKIREECEKNKWSFLKVNKNQLALVQNIAIRRHTNAEWIFKIDEDIVLPLDYFSEMKKAYNIAKDQMPVEPGVISPCLNINAIGSPIFMKTMGLMDEYERKYGKYKVGNNWSANVVHMSSEFAKWILEKSLPFDGVVAEMKARNINSITWCPTRLSIGAILFKRQFWKDLGYFKVANEGELGYEEEQVCSFCINQFRGIYMADWVFAGHLGFHQQKAVGREFYEQHKQELFVK